MYMGAHGFEAESRNAMHDDSAPRSAALCRGLVSTKYARPCKLARSQVEPPFEYTQTHHMRSSGVHGGTWFRRRTQDAIRDDSARHALRLPHSAVG